MQTTYKGMHFSSFQFVALPLIALDNKDLVKNQKNVASNWWWFVCWKAFYKMKYFYLLFMNDDKFIIFLIIYIQIYK